MHNNKKQASEQQIQAYLKIRNLARMNKLIQNYSQDNKYLNQFHKESEERKMKFLEEQKNLPRTYESVMKNQEIREQRTEQLQERTLTTEPSSNISMKAIYYSPNFPLVTTMELNKPMLMTEYLLQKELERLIAEEKEQIAIQQTMNFLILPEQPIDRKELLVLMMETDEIQILIQEVKGTLMVIADEEMIGEYEEKTLYNFLAELTNWLETR